MTEDHITTHCHWFLQKNMIAFLGKGHGWILHKNNDDNHHLTALYWGQQTG